MADILSQLPVKITDGTNTVAIASSALTVGGTVTATAGTGTFTMSPTGTQTVAGTGTFTVAPTGTQTVTGTVTLSSQTVTLSSQTVTIGATSVTQPVSGTVVANAGTGTFTIAPLVGSTVTDSIVASNSLVTYNVSNAVGAYVSVHGSYTGVAFNFQASDDGGTTYYPLSAVRTDGTAAESSSGTISNTSRAWFVYFGSATNFQVAATAFSTGTANIRITPVANDVPYLPVSSASSSVTIAATSVTQPVSGTVTANAGSGTFTVAGTVTNVPSGTQTVAGTVTANAGSGTFTVVQASGSTVTTVPSGTQTVTPGEVTSGIVHNYQTSAAVASGSSATFNYTVTSGKTLLLKAIQAASSGGPCKFWVQDNSGPTVFATGFYSASSPTLEISFPQPLSFAAAHVVGLIIQNNAGASQDLYGFINGHEV